ncbi:MAG: hypothetical protein IJ733_19700 [Lachnospiraceae bacterium]|nr:hypothetical protein [Lachnospiraceae bacterium]
MRKRTLVMYGCVTALTLAMMTGCGTSIANASKNSRAGVQSTESAQASDDASDSAASNGSSSDDKKGKKPQDDGSKMVQVTKVDGNTITATVGEDMRGGGGKGPGNGKAPSGKSGDGNSDDKQASSSEKEDGDSSGDKQAPAEKKDGTSSASKEQPPEKPDSDSGSGNSSSDDKKGGPRGGGMPFTATDETMTFTITSDTKITKGGRNSSTDATADDIKENSILRVTVNENNEAQTIVIMGGKNK